MFNARLFSDLYAASYLHFTSVDHCILPFEMSPLTVVQSANLILTVIFKTPDSYVPTDFISTLEYIRKYPDKISIVNERLNDW